MKNITLICHHCQQSFDKTLSAHNRSIKRGQINSFCNRTCFLEFNSKNLVTYSGTCMECNSTFIRDRRPSKSDRMLFCNNSCSAKYSNRNRRDNTKYVCPYCPNSKKPASKSCRECSNSRRNRSNNLDNKTLEELKLEYGHAQYHAKLRGDSRATYLFSKKPMSCSICDYDKHVDICHIIDIKNFPMETLVSEVNNINNLVALCRNHHWEFDHNKLSTEDMTILDLFITKLTN